MKTFGSATTFHVSDLEASISYYTEVTAKGARTQAAPKDYEYGMRDFVIEDPDANHIGIGQETKKG